MYTHVCYLPLLLALLVLLLLLIKAKGACQGWPPCWRVVVAAGTAAAAAAPPPFRVCTGGHEHKRRGSHLTVRGGGEASSGCTTCTQHWQTEGSGRGRRVAADATSCMLLQCPQAQRQADGGCAAAVGVAFSDASVPLPQCSLRSLTMDLGQVHSLQILAQVT